MEIKILGQVVLLLSIVVFVMYVGTQYMCVGVGVCMRICNVWM